MIASKLAGPLERGIIRATGALPSRGASHLYANPLAGRTSIQQYSSQPLATRHIPQVTDSQKPLRPEARYDYAGQTIQMNLPEEEPSYVAPLTPKLLPVLVDPKVVKDWTDKIASLEDGFLNLDQVDFTQYSYLQINSFLQALYNSAESVTGLSLPEKMDKDLLLLNGILDFIMRNYKGNLCAISLYRNGKEPETTENYGLSKIKLVKDHFNGFQDKLTKEKLDVLELRHLVLDTSAKKSFRDFLVKNHEKFGIFFIFNQRSPYFPAIPPATLALGNKIG